jgi:PAS domain S-box-containing protein
MTAPDINPQEQLGHAMALFSAVFHQNPEAATLTRTSDGLLVEVNDAWLSMTGFTRTEVLGKTTLELGVWARTEQREMAVAALKAGQASVSIEAVLVTKMGIKRPMRFNGTRFLLNGEAHMLGFISEITDQQHSAEEVKVKLDFIEQLTRRVPVLLFQFRLRADGSAHLPYVTRALQLFFDLSADQVMEDAATAFKLVHPDDIAAMWQTIKNSARDLTQWRHEFRVKRANGTELWLLGDSTPMRQDDGSTLWYGSVIDITQSRLQREELEKTREQMSQKATALRIALENMSQGMVTMDATGTITLYNQQFLQLLDLPQSLMTEGVNGSVLMKFQTERGDFGPDYELLDPKAKDDIMAGDVRKVPEHYFRKTRRGLTLQIKSRALPDGGLVRTFTDVSHFANAQAALHHSETRFRSLTALSSDWYWEQDENYRFVRVDGHNLDLKNFPVEDYVGKSRWEVGYQGLTQLQWSQHRQELDAHQVFRNLEVKRTGLDGKVVWSSINGAPIFDDQVTAALGATSPSKNALKMKASAWRFTTRSPACPIAACCWTGWRRRSSPAGATTAMGRCCSLTWTTSKT